MEWSIDTYIRDNPDNLTLEDLMEIQVLREIRNQVFFPDYKQYGYIPKESLIGQMSISGSNSLELGLISVSANRSLWVGYTWSVKKDVDNKFGMFSQRISILNEEYGWDNMIEIDILAMKRAGVDIKNYQLICDYPGSFEEKSMACLKQIKYNFDTYARDIISGENWDRNAWTDPR